MRKRVVWIVGALSLLLAAWLGAQALAPVKAPAELMPSGALFYVEARNFARLVGDWNSSPENKAWLETANFKSFERSHLLTRLQEARKDLTRAAGVQETAPLLAGVAGGESAVAFYDIGKLEFLYITQLSSARFADSALGKVRQKFQPRKAGGRDYFVLSKGENTIAFALVNEWLMLATREDLIASSLRLLAGEKIGALREEAWFDQAWAQAPAAGDVRLVANIERTAKTPQFRTYWIHQNVSEVRQFASEVADLKLGAAEVREERVFLRREAANTMPGAATAVAELARYAAPDAGFYQVVARPSVVDAAELMAQKLFGHGRALEQQYQSKTAPDAPDGQALVGEDDFETRVDVPQTATESVDAFAPLKALASNTDALLQAGIVQTAAVLPGIDAAVVLHGVAAWNAADVKRVLGQVAGSAWSASSSLDWTDRNGYSELASVAPLRFAIQSKALLISASPEWMARLMAVRQATPAGGPTYMASLRYGSELPGFTRMMRLIDFPSMPQGDQDRTPLFFSENIASLAGVMSRLDSVTITAQDTGTMVRENIVYRRK